MALGTELGLFQRILDPFPLTGNHWDVWERTEKHRTFTAAQKTEIDAR